jgi:spore coat polysaccharide biosynthesis protein SpsF
MLRFMLDRLQALPVDHLVVATTDLPRDDAVAALASEAGVQSVRGSETDVLGRFALAVRAHPADTVVRLTGDCPLADPELVADALELHESATADYTSNALIRTYPDGLDVEVIRTTALMEADAEAGDGAEREHVTPFLYRRPARYRLVALRTDELLGDERWTVDTAEDLDRVRRFVDQLADPMHAGWRDVLAVAGRAARPQFEAVRLRPAVAGDTGYDPETATDPSVRAWVVEVGGAEIGTARAEVDDGRATVHLSVPAEHEAVTLRQAQAALGLQAARVEAESAP